MYFGTSTNAELCSLTSGRSRDAAMLKSNDNIDLFIEGGIPIAGM